MRQTILPMWNCEVTVRWIVDSNEFHIDAILLQVGKVLAPDATLG